MWATTNFAFGTGNVENVESVQIFRLRVYYRSEDIKAIQSNERTRYPMRSR